MVTAWVMDRPHGMGYLFGHPRSERWVLFRACAAAAHARCRLQRQTPPLRGDSVVSLVAVALITVLPRLVLGLVALMRARREDIPTVIRALARWGRR
nr:MAG: hypothetical protein DIU60_00945 [Actinomycetota bacterium]